MDNDPYVLAPIVRQAMCDLLPGHGFKTDGELVVAFSEVFGLPDDPTNWVLLEDPDLPPKVLALAQFLGAFEILLYNLDRED